MATATSPAPRLQVLLVEDNPADALLMQEAFDESASAMDLAVAADGDAVIDAPGVELLGAK